MSRADQRKYHYIYKITRFDGKYYIGLHSTDDLEDGYFGSGSYLSRSVKKHGKDKHTKEIVEFLTDRTTLRAREKELVNEVCIADLKCMNLLVGGGDGYSGTHRDVSLAKISRGVKALWQDPNYREKVSSASAKRWESKTYREKMCHKISKGLQETEGLSALHKAKWQDQNYRETMIEALKTTHSNNSLRWQDPSYKEKMSLQLSAHNKKRWADPVWIRNNEGLKKIERSDLEEYLSKGYTKGRAKPLTLTK